MNKFLQFEMKRKRLLENAIVFVVATLVYLTCLMLQKIKISLELAMAGMAITIVVILVMDIREFFRKKEGKI